MKKFQISNKNTCCHSREGGNPGDKNNFFLFLGHWSLDFGHWTFNQGFTLVELMLAIAIAGILMGFMTMNLLNAQHKTSLSGAVETLISDAKSQQIKAMENASSSNGGYYGIHFPNPTNNTYILFQRSTSGYGSANSNDFTVSADSNLKLSGNGNDIVFNPLSGELNSQTTQTITLTNTAGSSEQKVVTLNKYGVITGVN